MIIASTFFPKTDMETQLTRKEPSNQSSNAIRKLVVENSVRKPVGRQRPGMVAPKWSISAKLGHGSGIRPKDARQLRDHRHEIHAEIHGAPSIGKTQTPLPLNLGLQPFRESSVT